MRTIKPLQMLKRKLSASVTLRVKKSSSRIEKIIAKMTGALILSKVLKCTIRWSRTGSMRSKTNRTRTPSLTKTKNRHLIVMLQLKKKNVTNVRVSNKERKTAHEESIATLKAQEPSPTTLTIRSSRAWTVWCKEVPSIMLAVRAPLASLPPKMSNPNHPSHIT